MKPTNERECADDEARFREKLLPMVPDLIRGRTIVGVHRRIIAMFEVAFSLAADAIAPPAEFEDFRHELRHVAAIRASAAVRTALSESNADASLRKHVELILDAFLAFHVDPSGAPVRRLDQNGEFRPVDLDASVHDVVFKLGETWDRTIHRRLAGWKPGRPTKEQQARARSARVARFVDVKRAEGIEIIPAMIYHSAEIKPNDYYAWLRAAKHKDGKRVANAIDEVLNGSVPLKRQ
jgi:hypothetical protein